MGIARLNHAVLFVRDVARSVAFYGDVLGFSVVLELPGRSFLRAPASTNDHDLGLFEMGDAAADSPAGRSAVGMYHLGWEVGTLDELAAVAGSLRSAGALVGATDHGTTKSVYARDPDGLEFEVAWLVPAVLIDEAAVAGRAVRGRALDLDAEIARYGGATRGGIGVSVAAG